MILEVKRHVSEWSHLDVCWTDSPTGWRQKSAEGHQHLDWVVKKIGAIKNWAGTVQRRVAIAHGGALPEQVHPGVRRFSHMQAPCHGRVRQDLCPRGGGRSQSWVFEVQEVYAGVWQKELVNVVAHSLCPVAGQKCSSHPAAPSCARVGLVHNNLEQEDARPVFEEGMSRMRTGTLSDNLLLEEEESRRGPCLRAFSRHRIFHHRGTIVSIRCGGYSMWVNRKLRRECPGNLSKLGMEVLKRMANRETPRLGQDWPFTVEDVPQSGMVAAVR